MRAFLVALLVMLAAATAGLLALPDPSGPRQQLTPRQGMELTAAKTWGYQLQGVNPRLVLDPIDLLVVDYSRDGSGARAFSPYDVERLRLRTDGTRRIVLCYLSIGEAENYRYYWRWDWKVQPPAWLGPENASWKGNYDVQFWNPAWQKLILDPVTGPQTVLDRLMVALFPQAKAYIDHIIDAGFDGVYLDRLDAYERARPSRPTSKADMIAFVEAISRYAKQRRPGFLIMVQNAEELLADARYRRVVDAIAKEDLYFGMGGDGAPNSPGDVKHSIALLNRAKAEGRPVFVVEYVADPARQRETQQQLRLLGYTGTFATRSLNQPPQLPPG